MESILILLVVLFIGMVIGGVFIWIIMRMKINTVKQLAGRDSESNIILLESLEKAEAKLNLVFENTANKIFEKKQETFKIQSKESLTNTINPLKKEFKEFKEKVESIHIEDIKGRQTITDLMEQLKKNNQQISQDAINLTNALKGDKQKQGSWGEVQLERVLEDSGLKKGREYETQVHLKGEDGKSSRPDVIIRLPENKDIVIDSKVSLINYERFCSAEVADEKQEALKNHIQALKNHVEGLSLKSYENLEGLRTLDFVLIFIPIEPAFLLAFEAEPQLFQRAFEKNIIVVSPTTLIPVLKTVHSIWRYERQSKNAEAIARQAGDLHDKFVLFLESMLKIDKQIDNTRTAYNEAFKRLYSGTGNIIGRTKKIQDLGAKTKKNIPPDILNTASN